MAVSYSWHKKYRNDSYRRITSGINYSDKICIRCKNVFLGLPNRKICRTCNKYYSDLFKKS